MIGRAINILLGIWLMASPAMLDHTQDAARNNDWIVGPIVASIACIAFWEVTRPLRWVNLGLGAWLMLAPWVLGYATVLAGLNSMIVGAAIALASLHKGRLVHDFGGGWSSLRRMRYR